MAVDISGLSYFMPIFGFLFVFVIIFALLQKTKILGGSKWVDALIGFIVAIIFATMSSVQEYVQSVVPWFVVLVIALLFILLIVGLSQHKIDAIVKPWFVWVFIVILILAFLLSATKVFSYTLNPVLDDIRSYVTTEDRVVGAVLLLIIAGAATWVITKK